MRAIGGMAAALAVIASAGAMAQSDESADVSSYVCGDRTLLVDQRVAAHPYVIVSFLRQDGALAQPSLFWTGSFLSLCEQGRFVLAADNRHFGESASFVMDFEGSIVARLELERMIGAPHATEGGFLFWVEWKGADGGKRASNIAVFDYRGREVAVFSVTPEDYARSNTVTVSFEGEDYRIPVGAPDYAG